MNITDVKVFPVNEEKLKAFVSIIFDDCFVVTDIKVINGNNGLFVSMPSKKRKNGTFRDVAHPLNNETRRMIEQRIFEEYHRVLEERGEAPQEPEVGGPPAPAAPMSMTPAADAPAPLPGPAPAEAPQEPPPAPPEPAASETESRPQTDAPAEPQAPPPPPTREEPGGGSAI